MKFLFLVLFIFGLVSCETYTVENSSTESIKAGGVLIKPGDCSYFVDFFYIFGDFPIEITKEDGAAIDAEKASYRPSHYEVLSASIKEVKMPCEKE